MVKLVTLVKRRIGISPESLLKQWKTVKSLLPMARGFRRQVINVAVAIPGREPRFDLVEESWWDQPERLGEALTLSSWRAWRDEAETLLEQKQSIHLMVAERVIIAPPADGRGVKTFNLIFRDPGRGFESFDHHWKTGHAQLVAKLPLLRGYVQCPVLDAFGRQDAPDGVPVAWYDSVAAGRISMHSAERKPIDVDEAGFVARERTVRVVTEELA